MKVNHLGFSAVIPVSIGHCSFTEYQQSNDACGHPIQEIKNNSLDIAGAALNEKSKKLSADGLPHTPFKVADLSKFNAEIEALGKIGKLPKDIFNKQLVEIHHHIATGDDHEKLAHIKSLQDSFKNGETNTAKKDSALVDKIFARRDIKMTLVSLKKQVEEFLHKYGQRITK